MSGVRREDKAPSPVPDEKRGAAQKRLAPDDMCRKESTGNDMITGNVDRRQQQNRTNTANAEERH